MWDSYKAIKSYTFGDQAYLVKRHEEWENDETTVWYTIVRTANGKTLTEIYDAEWDVWPSRLRVLAALVDAKAYTPTPAEQHALDVDRAERAVKHAARMFEQSDTTAKAAREAVATAVETAIARAEHAEANRDKRAAELAKYSVALAELRAKAPGAPHVDQIIATLAPPTTSHGE